MIVENTVKTHSAMSNVTSLTINKLAIAVSLSLAVVMLSGCDSKEETTVTTPIIRPALTQIVMSKADTSLSFNGVIRSAERADLSFQVNGRVSHIFVNEGDKVHKGQLLAKLDPKDAQTAFTTAQLELNNTKKDYLRGKSIYESSQAIAKSDLDELMTRYNLAQNRLENAKNQLAYTQLIAPFDGIIGRKLIDNHVRIQANTPVLTLHNLDDLEVVVNIPDTVMLTGLKCEKANAEITTIPGHLLPLSLRTYSTQADPITQTFSIVLGLDDSKGLNILPGMPVRVTPSVDECPEDYRDNKNNPLTVPLTAVVPDNQNKQFVWIVNTNNIVEKRYIKVGTINKNCITVPSGLKAGERVVIAGVSKLKTGMEIRPYTDNTQDGA
ncbi:efflux RND transporter periplasmic adaptor subunit [Photobacterium kishitanii]